MRLRIMSSPDCKRKVQMRHQARLLGDGVDQVRVGLDLVDGGQAQAPQLGDLAQDLPHEPAQGHLARQDRRRRR